MKRQFMVLFALAAVIVATAVTPAHAVNGRGGHGGHGGGHGFGGGGGGFGGGCGLGGFGLGVGGYGGGCGGWDIAALYNQLYNNLPYFALHPPVYYSDVVPRTYGYSPFAYPPGVMTPDLSCASQPVTIDNPFVPATKPAAPASTESTVDRAAAAARTPEPLVIMNPFCPASTVAQTEK